MRGDRVPEAKSGREVEWQFDALDVRPVERWLAPYVATATAGLAGDEGDAGVSAGSRGAGPARFTVRPEPARFQVDVYADTDDWRLFRAGFSLRVRRHGRAAEATLKSFAPPKDGLRDRSELNEAVPNLDLDTLPASGGEVGRRVRAVAGTRPLQRILEVRTRRQKYALEVGGRGAAEIALDRTSIRSAPGQEPARLRRVEVEMRDGELETVEPFVRAMAEQCGLRPAKLSKFEAGLMALGLGPPPPPDLGPVEVGPAPSVGELAFAALRRHFGAFLENEPGTRLGEDPDALHDMRVATRRIRAAIKLFEEVLPVRVVRARDELRWVADALGAVRDLDVQLERLQGWIDEADRGDREPLAALRGVLESEREEARAVLLEVLDSARYRRLVTGLIGLLRRGPLRTSPASRVPAVVVAPELAAARYRKVRKAARRLKGDPAPEDFHRVRIRGKRFRYTLEFLSELYGDEPGPLIKRLEKLQDHLGLLQDAVVAVARLRGLAVREDLSPTTVFAMGQVAERYRRQAADLQKRAPKVYRQVLGKRWKELHKTMERVRAASGWSDRRPVLRPVEPAPTPAIVPAATGGSA
ncbi:MAG: CHAD domain-containing protein [Actinomycetota bacterium]|nr:CHAD domain-containing protein [Actinomycetota bacterium]